MVWYVNVGNTKKAPVKNLSVKNYSDLINNRRIKLVLVQTENISWEYIFKSGNKFTVYFGFFIQHFDIKTKLKIKM